MEGGYDCGDVAHIILEAVREGRDLELAKRLLGKVEPTSEIYKRICIEIASGIGKERREGKLHHLASMYSQFCE